MINDALYYFTLWSINCSHYITITASTGSKNVCQVQVHRKFCDTEVNALHRSHEPFVLMSLHPNIAFISPGQSSSQDRRHQAGTLVLFTFRQIPSSELKLRQLWAISFFFFSFLISSLNDSTLLNNWQTCTNCAPGIDPSACSTQHCKISDPVVTIGQIVRSKMTKHL